MLISYAVAAQLICVFVFAYANIRISHDVAQITFYFSYDDECEAFGPLNIPFTRVRRFLRSLSGTRLVIAAIVLVALMGLVVFLGVFPNSFVYVEYHQVRKTLIITICPTQRGSSVGSVSVLYASRPQINPLVWHILSWRSFALFH